MHFHSQHQLRWQQKICDFLPVPHPHSDRNTFKFGFTPQAELWNGRLAMIGFLAYLLWDYQGYSVLRDVLNFIR